MKPAATRRRASALRDDLHQAKRSLVDMVQQRSEDHRDLGGLIKRHPIAALALAFAVGIVATRSAGARNLIKIGLGLGAKAAISKLLRSR
ncbi:MAG: hypothetical protein ACREJT_02985 [Myxococcota bacterium]